MFLEQTRKYHGRDIAGYIEIMGKDPLLVSSNFNLPTRAREGYQPPILGFDSWHHPTRANERDFAFVRLSSSLPYAHIHTRGLTETIVGFSDFFTLHARVSKANNGFWHKTIEAHKKAAALLLVRTASFYFVIYFLPDSSFHGSLLTSSRLYTLYWRQGYTLYQTRSWKVHFLPRLGSLTDRESSRAWFQ